MTITTLQNDPNEAHVDFQINLYYTYINFINRRYIMTKSEYEAHVRMIVMLIDLGKTEELKEILLKTIDEDYKKRS